MCSNIIEACQKIGDIAEGNGVYTDGIIRRIQLTGKDITELTVGELLQINAEHNRFFNKVYGQGGMNA